MPLISKMKQREVSSEIAIVKFSYWSNFFNNFCEKDLLHHFMHFEQDYYF